MGNVLEKIKNDPQFARRFRARSNAERLRVRNSGVPVLPNPIFVADYTTGWINAKRPHDPANHPSATFTRATTAGVRAYAAGAVSGDNPLYIQCASGESRFQGLRRVSQGVWSKLLSDGTAIDPDTSGVPWGYLAEGARTNLCLQSNSFGTAWSDSSGTPTQSQDTTGPDGLTSAWTVTDNDGATIELKTQTVSVANDTTTYTYSIYVKKTSSASSFPGFGLRLTGGTALNWYFLLNTDAGTATARSINSAGATASVSDEGNFWRIRISGANNATGNVTAAMDYGPAVATSDTSTWAGAAQGTAVIYGAQLEAAAFPSTYIPTTTAAVTRNADVLTYSSTGNVNESEGTLYAAGVDYATTNLAAGFVALSDGTVNNEVYLWNSLSGTGAATINTTKAGGNSGASSTDNNTCPKGQAVKLAGRFATNDVNAGGNGAVDPSPDTSADPPTGLTTIHIGNRGNASVPIYAAISEVRIYDRALSAAQHQALTA